jgi:hypothetical protein
LTRHCKTIVTIGNNFFISKAAKTGKRIDVLPQLQFDWIAEASFYSVAGWRQNNGRH